MKIAIIAIGLPGSGKTTLLKPLAKKYGLIYINKDDIREEFLGDAGDRSRNKEVWQESNRRITTSLEEGHSFVLDSTLFEQRKRRETVQFVRQAGADRIVGLFMNTDLHDAEERNRSRKRVVKTGVLHRMHQNLSASAPSLDDGFDALYTAEEVAHLEERELLGL